MATKHKSYAQKRQEKFDDQIDMILDTTIGLGALAGTIYLTGGLLGSMGGLIK